MQKNLDPEPGWLFEHAQRHAAESAGEVDDPEDDIMPVFLWTGPYGMGLMPCVPMGSGKDKDRIAAAMMAALVVSRATEAAFVSSSWTVKHDRGPDEAGPHVEDLNNVMPSEHPNRMECLVVMYGSQKGAGLATAEVIRHKDKPPTVGKWDTWEGNDAKVGGRFGEAINDGLAMAQASPPEMIEIIELAWREGEQADLMQRFLKVYGNFTGVTGVGVMAMPGPLHMPEPDPDKPTFKPPKRKGQQKRG